MDIWRFWFRVLVVLVLASGIAQADETGDPAGHAAGG